MSWQVSDFTISSIFSSSLLRCPSVHVNSIVKDWFEFTHSTFTIQTEIRTRITCILIEVNRGKLTFVLNCQKGLYEGFAAGFF